MWPQRPANEASVKGYAADLERERQATAARNLAAVKDAIMRSWPAELAKSAYGAATLPGDVYAGRVDPKSREAVQRAFDLAGFVTLGAGAVPAGRNEMRAGIKLRGGGETAETDLAWYFKDVKRKPGLSPMENRRFSSGAADYDAVAVPVRALNATQSKVNPDFSSTSTSAGELPYVFRKDGELYVSDGHHRINRAVHEGAQNVNVRLLDFDRRDTSAPLLDWSPEKAARSKAETDELMRLLFGE